LQAEQTDVSDLDAQADEALEAVLLARELSHSTFNSIGWLCVCVMLLQEHAQLDDRKGPAAGQKDRHKPTVYSLAYLKELHEGTDPRFTGC
jgi:hypothetical protein